MENRRSKLAMQVLTIVGKVLFVVVAVYAGCYYFRSAVLMEGETTIRIYGTAVEARMFTPAANLESLVRGARVIAHHPEK